MQRHNVHSFCGLDFGTSNSTLGAYANDLLTLIPLENNKAAIRSAIFCDAELKKWLFGQEAIDRYLERAPGRLLMALKSVLGTSLMDDETLIFREYISYSRILGKFISHIKSMAENHLDSELSQVVIGRPVRFHDTNPVEDKKAQQTLEAIARDVGFKDILFQYEPIAAALAYEINITSEQLALIIDMGGGTSDFTVIRLRPNMRAADRTADVLANSGIHIAGTDFDYKLSLNTLMPLLGMGSTMQGSSSRIEVPAFYYHDLATWHSLTSLYDSKNISQLRSIQTMAEDKQRIARLIKVIQNYEGHHLLDLIEKSKQHLSEQTMVSMDLAFIEDPLAIDISRENLNEAISDYINEILGKISQTIALAGVNTTDINAVFYTGGSSKIPAVRNQINQLFPDAEIVLGDVFGSVGMGLTIDAQRRFI